MLQAKGRGGRQPSHSRHLHHATHAPHHAAHAPHHSAHAPHHSAHGPHPAAHGPRIVASRGRGVPAAAANAPPRQGNAVQSGMRSTGIAPPPSSYRNRQSAAQMQKSTWPVNNVSHMPSAAGDGHPPRKPAVHAGVPRAKKLPAADRNISVRCTWSNNVASEVQRTVSVASSNQQSASAQPQYRAPSPPGSPSTAVTTCPEDLRKKLQRLRMCDPQVLTVFFFTGATKTGPFLRRIRIARSADCCNTQSDFVCLSVCHILVFRPDEWRYDCVVFSIR